MFEFFEFLMELLFGGGGDVVQNTAENVGTEDIIIP